MVCPSNDARVFVDALVPLGVSGRWTDGCGGIEQVVLEDPDARIPCEGFGAYRIRDADSPATTNLGVKMAKHVDRRISASGLSRRRLDSVGHGLRQLARYFRLVGTPTEIEIREDEIRCAS